MEYNFINVAFFIGLLGCIPWAMFFAVDHPDGHHLRLQMSLIWLQCLCLAIATGNVLYGLFVLFF